MAIFLLIICALIFCSVVWIVVVKIHKKQHFLKKQKQAEQTQASWVETEHRQTAYTIEIEAYEQLLFDDVATLFLQQSTGLKQDDAEPTQYRILAKMPAKTQTQIHTMDLNEWCIFWSFYGQSLECYVSRYGSFYTHVDRYGNEHKKSYTLSN